MHLPVLKKEIIDCFDYLAAAKDGVFVDGTLGAAGHSVALAQSLKLKAQGRIKFVGIDRDKMALGLAEQNVATAGLSDWFSLIHDNFKSIKSVLGDKSIEKISGALLDLGVSSMQLDQKERGFSFADPGQPLDMRMDQTVNFTAADIVNQYPEGKLVEILYAYGEEKNARRIAHEIIATRKEKPLSNVGDLVEAISQTTPARERHQKIHFATRTFQALRIEVNQELVNLDQAIADYIDLLEPDGRLAVISFHSLEDRIVKNAFKKAANPCECPAQMPCICGKKSLGQIVTKKPIVANEEEVKKNPRSRSAKLRIFEVSH